VAKSRSLHFICKNLAVNLWLSLDPGILYAKTFIAVNLWLSRGPCILYAKNLAVNLWLKVNFFNMLSRFIANFFLYL